MTTAILSTVVKRYEAAIDNLEKAREDTSLKDVQEVLAARQAACNALNEELRNVTLTPSTWVASTGASSKHRSRHRKLEKIVEDLDARLDKQYEVIRRASGLSYQQIEHLFSIEKRWKAPEYNIPWHDHFDLLWQFLSVLCFGFSAVLLIDIVKRSLTGGVDIGSGTAALSATFISMLSGGGLLTKFGQEKTGDLFKKLRISENLWDEARCLISVGFTLLLVGLWLLLPSFAGGYIKAANDAENLARQEDYYLRAIALKPGSVEAHLGLAKLYVNQQEVDKALPVFKAAYSVVQKNDLTKACEAAESISQIFLDKAEYSKADRWLTRAVNFRKSVEDTKLFRQQTNLCQDQFNLMMALGRVYLLNEKKPLEAIRWFKQGLDIPEQDPLKQAQRRYEMQIHLARGLLSEDLLQESESNLKDAIELDEEEVAIYLGKKRAAAHCLMAQVMEKQGDADSIKADAIKTEWEQCSQKTSPEIADEVNWQKIALKRLTHLNAKGNPNEIQTITENDASNRITFGRS